MEQLTVAVKPEVAISHMMGRNPHWKVYAVIQDGSVWRWRVTYPNSPKLGATSTEAFETREKAERTMHNVANCTRPSICIPNAFQDVPANAGQPAENRVEWVGA